MSTGLRVDAMTVDFGHGWNRHRALDEVSFQLALGRTLGIVGESGSGKSTLAKALVGLVPLTAGGATIDGEPLRRHRRGRAARAEARRIQLIPQDPYSSLDPRRSIGQAIAEAIDPAGGSVARHREAIGQALVEVQLDPAAIDRMPHEFSGGQRQRVAIARALAARPLIVIADEITSALDVSVQAQVLDTLERIRAERNLTLLFISHNLAVVSRISDDLLVMRRGRIVEAAPARQLFGAPQHPYSRQLLASIPGTPGFSLT